MEDIWSERDTTPARIDAALRDLLAHRHRSERTFVPARVLNLVAIVDADYRGEIENRLERVGRFHPSRLILCAVHPGQKTLDATAVIGTEQDAPIPGVITVGHERVEIDMGPEHLGSIDTVVDPLLVSDLATTVWSPHGHHDAIERLRRLVQIVLLDSQDEDPPEALSRAEDLSHNVYVVDLAWLRSTPWRERVAAAFDPEPLRRALGEIARVQVRHRPDSTASALLFCGWLASRLGWRPDAMISRGTGTPLRGRARARRGEVTLELQPVPDLPAPGLGGVTIETASGEAISLDRAPGGLRSVRRMRDGREQSWQVLGASRGEAGILGEGVRQALLRDATYRPALEAARVMAA
jgi:glucose-6-phosphate dehydrogenase assembly protein OpcA